MAELTCEVDMLEVGELMRPETGSPCSPVGSPRWSWQELVDAAALSSADVVEMDTSMAMPAATAALGAARAAWHEKMPTAFAPMPSAVPLLPDAGEVGASEAAERDVKSVLLRGGGVAQLRFREPRSQLGKLPHHPTAARVVKRKRNDREVKCKF